MNLLWLLCPPSAALLECNEGEEVAEDEDQGLESGSPEREENC